REPSTIAGQRFCPHEPARSGPPRDARNMITPMAATAAAARYANLFTAWLAVKASGLDDHRRYLCIHVSIREETHHMMDELKANMPPIALPRILAPGVHDYLVARKVVNILVLPGPLSRRRAKDRFREHVRDDDVLSG